MTEERTYGPPPGRAKGRSASICAATHAVSLEALPPPPPSGASPDANRRRRPAARSQSARTAANRRSVRTRVNPSPASHPNGGVAKSQQQQSTSEPKLAEQPQLLDNHPPTPDVSPHIRRKGSQRRGASVHHRKSTAFLDVPETRSRSDAAAGEEEDEDSYRLRSFSFTSKGIVNRGDSFRRRRSRSNSLCPPTGAPSPVADEPAREGVGGGGSEVASYAVALLGAPGVGKTALISQFMTSECINAYDGQKDLLGAQTVSIMLNGEESELTFQNSGTMKDVDKLRPPDAFVVMYSVVDKASFLKAEVELTRLQDADLLRSRPAILVANKIDLARSRAVSTQDGKCLACTFRAKFTEISVGINHNVDELLVGILTQIRLKVLHFEEGGHSAQWYKSRGMVKASMKARQMFTWLFGKEDSKFKNCENLHTL